VVFLNGLPIAVIELKDPTDTEADLGVAIDQLGRYMHTAPELFVPNLAAGGLGRHADAGRLDHQRSQPLHALAAARTTRAAARRRWRR
jgi:hypothetical protein